MGVVASYQLRRADRRMAKILVFVKCAYAGDVAKLLEIIYKEKMPPNAQDRFGMTALHWAAYGGKLICVQELLKAGASLSVLDDNGRNALHHACRKDHDEVVRFLVTELKMDVNAITESKDTPLHKAICGKSIRTVELLLQLGANPNLRNDQNLTPLEELDADPGQVKDVVPEPIVTARMEVELNNWRQEFLTEINSTGRSGRRRSSLELMMTPTSKLLRDATHALQAANESTVSGRSSKKYTSATSVREVENTLVTNFRSKISEFSDRSSSRSGSAHFPTTGLWAKPSSTNAAAAGSTAGSSPATGRRYSANEKGIVVPLNLNGLQPSDGTASQASSATSIESQSSVKSTTRSLGNATPKPYARRNLRYVGKRVIMALRVKKCMSGDEKREMIRLLLVRHLKAMDSKTNGADAVQQIGDTRKAASDDHTNGLVRASSDFTISLPPLL